jgi:glutaredoxin
MFHVYSKPDCTWCSQAKALLTAKDLPFKEYIVDVGQQKTTDGTYVTRGELLAAFPGARTVPQIEIRVDGHRQYIGGFTELKQHLN